MNQTDVNVLRSATFQDRSVHTRSVSDKDTGRPFRSANLQEIFLNNCRKNQDVVEVILVTDSAQCGTIIGFDSQSLILDIGKTQSLIYKSSIAKIEPASQVKYIFNEELMKEYKRSTHQF